MLNDYSRKAKEDAESRARIVLKLRTEWKSYAEIITETWFSRSMIVKYLKRMGYTKVVRKFLDEEKKQALKLYEDYLNIKEIWKVLWRDPSILYEYFVSLGLETDIRKRIKIRDKALLIANYVNWDTIFDLVKKTWVNKNNVCLWLKENWLSKKSNKNKTCICWYQWVKLDFCWKKCKTCYWKEKHKANYKNVSELWIEEFINYKLNVIRSSSLKRWLEFDLDYDYLKLILEKSNLKCIYTLKDIWEWKMNLSIDRFDNSKWYIKWNVIPCCLWINEKKWDFSIEELNEYMPIIFERWDEFLKSIHKSIT